MHMLPNDDQDDVADTPVTSRSRVFGGKTIRICGLSRFQVHNTISLPTRRSLGRAIPRTPNSPREIGSDLKCIIHKALSVTTEYGMSMQRTGKRKEIKATSQTICFQALPLPLTSYVPLGKLSSSVGRRAYCLLHRLITKAT